MILRTLICLWAAFILAGCASTSFSVLEINSLAATEAGEGEFDGLEDLANRAPRSDIKRVNILFLHGIGWVENPDDSPLANNFIKGLANAYELDTQEKTVSSLCGRDEENEDKRLQNHILINEAKPKFYRTALPGSRLKLDNLVCMDKQVMRVQDDLEYVIYRIFWDEIFWRSLQYAHIGQDDSQGSSFNFASLRRDINRDLKDKMVNYGFSDAVMYLGPAGDEIRDAIRGAMCSAALDAAGVSFKEQGHEVNFKQICGTASNTAIKTDPFAFVTESLGSKIAFDVMRTSMTDGRETVHDEMIKGTQIYMLANQIPLLSLSDISISDEMAPSAYTEEERPTIIAFSEINDFLTYELVPFYEQLYKNSQRNKARKTGQNAEPDRRDLVDLLGFNIIDMRVEFASPLVPIVRDFVDPLFAHNGHVRQPEIMEYIICGADNGEAYRESCSIPSNKTAKK